MRKLVSLLLMAAVGILVLGSAALAEGFNVGGDYSVMHNSSDNTSIQFATVGGEFTRDAFLVGGKYQTALGYDPEQTFAREDSLLMIYGGYRLLHEKQFSLAAVAGYCQWETDVAADFSIRVNTTALGVKGGAKLGPVNISLTYLYGVSNYAEISLGGTDFGSNDNDVSLLELKGTYAIAKSADLYATYRSYNYSTTADSTTVSGFGVGCAFKL
ncbi:MAG: hypothetical protein ACM3TT_09435 [Syntrophothermus sp.]